MSDRRPEGHRQAGGGERGAERDGDDEGPDASPPNRRMDEAETGDLHLPGDTERRFDSAIVFEGREATEHHPDRIGPYKILEVLGEGGMGTVYLAAQMEPVRREVALKLIKRGMDTEEVVARFESERQALALMNHPGIARVYDAGAAGDGRPYFVMERVSGLPITDYCDRERLGLARRLELFARVCDGVQHAHQKAIIHRDIKPSNILVSTEDSRPVPKIIDFGLAKAIEHRLTEKTLFTEMGQIVGTPEYMSPEQAQAGDLDFDTRTDIYSLGVLLYEMLSGQLPFDSRTLREAGYAEIQRIIREVEPPRPSTRLRALDRTKVAERRRAHPKILAKQLRGDLDWIVMKAIEKDRDRRYATAGELAADVRRHLRHDPVLARPPSLLYRLKKLLRKHRGRAAAAAALLVFAAVFTAGSLYLDLRNRIEESRGLRQESRAQWSEFLESRASLEEIRTKLIEARKLYSNWQPIWERTLEIEARDELSRVRERIDRLSNGAVYSLQRALQIAPPGPEELAARTELGQIYWAWYRQALDERRVAFSPEFFAAMIRLQEVPSLDRLLEGSGALALGSDPPGADVFCFRYVLHDEHLLPIPFDPLAGRAHPEEALVGEPFLEIEEVWVAEDATFRRGDRWLEVGGRRIRLRSDLARALEDAGAGDSVNVKVRRAGKETLVSWIPYPERNPGQRARPGNPFRPGRVVDIRGQFGFTFAGYPLDFDERCRLGRTKASGPVEVELPRGSYLFVLRREGFVEARLPVEILLAREARHVRLFREDEVPRGFVHIPAGEFRYGGDEEAFQGLERGTAFVSDFFMSRLEVTLGDYLEFINDAHDRGRMDDDGGATPLADWGREDLKSLCPQERVKIRLIPLYGNPPTPPYGRDEKTGLWTVGEEDRDVPVLGVPMLAGAEYAHWLTEKRGNGWRFRLPRDLEWEKAARGADRRFYVWGDYLVASFCNTDGSRYRESPGALDPAGMFPLDESVYGIRDLAGSMKEPVLARAPAERLFWVVRGGSWQTTDLRDCRAATRNRRLPGRGYHFVGLRLVAVPPPAADGSARSNPASTSPHTRAARPPRWDRGRRSRVPVKAARRRPGTGNREGRRDR